MKRRSYSELCYEIDKINESIDEIENERNEYEIVLDRINKLTMPLALGTTVGGLIMFIIVFNSPLLYVSGCAFNVLNIIKKKQYKAKIESCNTKIKNISILKEEYEHELEYYSIENIKKRVEEKIKAYKEKQLMEELNEELEVKDTKDSFEDTTEVIEDNVSNDTEYEIEDIYNDKILDIEDYKKEETDYDYNQKVIDNKTNGLKLSKYHDFKYTEFEEEYYKEEYDQMFEIDRTDRYGIHYDPFAEKFDKKLTGDFENPVFVLIDSKGKVLTKRPKGKYVDR